MPLVDDVRALRDRALADLRSAHDYYTDTKSVWRIVQRIIRAGHKVTIRNLTTGTVTEESELAAKARAYVAVDLAEATFQQFVATFEIFFFDLLRLWLAAYPHSLGRRQIAFSSVLELADKDAITLHVVDKELSEISYKRPKEWFDYLDERVKLHCTSTDDIERIGEAKATRDVLTHNRGIANEIYRSKAGKIARYAVGQQIEVPENYHRETWELFRKVIADLSAAVEKKLA